MHHRIVVLFEVQILSIDAHDNRVDGGSEVAALRLLEIPSHRRQKKRRRRMKLERGRQRTEESCDLTWLRATGEMS